jgi:hypothetical protein
MFSQDDVTEGQATAGQGADAGHRHRGAAIAAIVALRGHGVAEAGVRGFD